MMRDAMQVIPRSAPEASGKVEQAFPSWEQPVTGETALTSVREILGLPKTDFKKYYVQYERVVFIDRV